VTSKAGKYFRIKQWDLNSQVAELKIQVLGNLKI
jgi:hypothetical protein